MTVVLELVGVRRGYRRRGEVLRGVDLRVCAGEPCVVVGGNGSGKSTLLRIAAGVTTPSAGTVRGRPPVVGFLPAPFPASSRSTVRAYLRHLAAIHGAAGRGRRRAEDVLEQLGFTGAQDGPVSELSTGNAQKVGLAQALCASPGLVVLDEPWTGLDTAAADVLDRLLADRARSVPVLVTDHGDRARGLPGARVHHLGDGLVEDEVRARRPPETDGWTEIEVRCPEQAERLVARLPEPVASRCTGRRLRVWVEPSHGDAWLVAALAAGCSVLLVRAATGTTGP